jgi:hypothetical protein
VPPSSACLSYACDPVAGIVATPAPTGTTCDDGNVCDGVALCNAAGSCEPGTPPGLDDGNPCTEDGCDPLLGVKHTPKPQGESCDGECSLGSSGDCEGGDLCSGPSSCDGNGACTTEPLDVDDGNPCTIDTCDPDLGPVHAPNAGAPCDDGQVCSESAVCDSHGTCRRPARTAGTVDWVDWTTTTAEGVVGVAGDVGVDYFGEMNPGAILGGSENYWASSSSTYARPPALENPPSNADIIRVAGGSARVMRVKFSRPVTNPVMSILSLGAPGRQAQFDFNGASFTILNNGPGYWGNGPLSRESGDVLAGTEGHGVIEFTGVFEEISWTNPIAEYWYGFNFGVHQELPCEPPGTCFPPPAGMVAWWPGDGNANDVVGGNNGTVQNGATFAPGGGGRAWSTRP